MVSSDEKDIFLIHPLHHLRKICIKIFQSFRVSFRIVPVSVEHIEIHQVHEQEPVKSLFQIRYRCLYPFSVVLRVVYFCKPSPVKDILNLTYADDIFSFLAEHIKKRIARRVHGKIFSILCAVIISAFSGKRTANDSTHRVISAYKLSGNLANFILSIQRNHAFVHSNLHQAVRRQIHNRVSSLYMFIPQHLNDFRTGSGIVPYDLRANPSLKFFNNPRRKRFSEYFKRRLYGKPRYFKMTVCRVFCLRALSGFSKTALRIFHTFQPCSLDIKETQRLHIRDI